MFTNDLKIKMIQIKVQCSEISFSTVFFLVCFFFFCFLKSNSLKCITSYVGKSGQEIVSHTLSFSKLNISLLSAQNSSKIVIKDKYIYDLLNIEEVNFNGDCSRQKRTLKSNP